MTCTVCARVWDEGTPACECGYDFTTRDPRLAIERFTREARHGDKRWRRGLVLMIALPITFSIGSLWTGMLLAMIQLALAALWIVQGLMSADTANRKLAAAKALIALPEARLVQGQPKPRS